MVRWIVAFVVVGAIAIFAGTFLGVTQANAQEVTAEAAGSACSDKGCAYVKNNYETLVSCDNKRDGHKLRAQGYVNNGQKYTVIDDNGANPGCGRTNPHGSGDKFVQIRSGWENNWTLWKPARR